jgi:NAD+ kinase
VSSPHAPLQATDAAPAFDPASVRCVGVLVAPHKPRIAHSLREIVAWFTARGVRVVLPSEQAGRFGLAEAGYERARLAEHADLIVAMGGDGTLLNAARLAAPHGTPILGINFGGFGFLAALPQEHMLVHLAEVMEGRFAVSDRMMMEAQVVRRGETVAAFLALNDIVIGKGAISRLFRLHTTVSGEAVSDFPADGMIISTPTGSTGYALSAGGPVVDPEVRIFLITPICPHTLSARSLVIPADRTIELSLPDHRGEDVYLTADGQEGMSLHWEDRVRIVQAPFSARLLGLAADTFYAKLRTKLDWGGKR